MSSFKDSFISLSTWLTHVIFCLPDGFLTGFIERLEVPFEQVFGLASALDGQTRWYKFRLTSENEVFYISEILQEIYSSCSMPKIYPEYLNFENISKNCIRVPGPIEILELQPRNFINKETLAQVFSCEFCEIFKNVFFLRTLQVAVSVQFYRIWMN